MGHTSSFARRLLGFTLLACVAAGTAAYALPRLQNAPAASAAPAQPPAESAVPAPSEAPSLPEAPASTTPEPQPEPEQEGLLTAAQARAMLEDPRMVLVNHSHRMPEDYTFSTLECGSDTAVNKTLQTEAAQAFLQLQAAAAQEGVTIWMQSGYRSVKYQTFLYDRKTQYYRDKGYDEAQARQKAAAIVNPPGYSEHNCGLAADLNSPEHTGLDQGFEDTAAFRWLCQHAETYGFILRYPQGAEAVTEITYEPWHWRYVGPENAALLNRSGLCFEDAIAALEQLAQGQDTAS